MLAQRELYSGAHETSLKIVRLTCINLRDQPKNCMSNLYKFACSRQKNTKILKVPPLNFSKALYLRDFEDLLPVHDLYCLLALSALLSGAYGVASKVMELSLYSVCTVLKTKARDCVFFLRGQAFIKLESMADLPDPVRRQLEDLSVEIFVK